jgi:hypothetical protein
VRATDTLVEIDPIARRPRPGSIGAYADGSGIAARISRTMFEDAAASPLPPTSPM